MEGNLKLDSNSYFYKIDRQLSKRQITQIAGEVSQKKIGRFKCRIKGQKKKINDQEVRYSLFVFELSKEPAFLVGSILRETNFGYLLMVEYDGYLVVNSKYAVGLRRALESVVEQIEYEKLSGFLITDETIFKRFSLKNTNISSYNTSIRKRTVEAHNLADSFTPLSASKQLVRSLKIRNEDEKDYSISLGTSRVAVPGKKVMFSEFCIWAINIIEKLKAYLPSNNYMQSFALPVDTIKLENLTPTTIMIDFSSVIDCINECDCITYSKDPSKEKTIDKNIVARIFKDDNCQSFELSVDPNNQKLYLVDNTYINDFYVKKNKKSIKVISKKLHDLYFHFEDESISFFDVINDSRQILINFSDIEYAYTQNELFYDHQLEKATQSFLSIFRPYKELTRTVSEKGSFSEKSKKFKKNTLFSFIENTFGDDDYLICDDLGHEVADYISVTENETINFYHAKSDHKKKLSASAFHVVVSQALKNLGNIVNVEKMDLKNKEAIWESYYSNTKISRITTKIDGGDASKAVDMLKTTSFASSSTKRVWLVVDFISKAELINQLKKGPNKRTIQIIWLLSSFVNDCREVGVQPRIACKP
ncbi:hypothetical protein KQI58_00850 [Enterococcus raffinosus]|uniref:hypothetical protein n=1 Tax=Enterococcus raffinosus TaxID=71452 RepID=UPI001C0FAC27|nr:hypothetical protein [Enterococcus raffinosus]MBU5359618.1 hypothetical protein [Enterococcus raffinosus]